MSDPDAAASSRKPSLTVPFRPSGRAAGEMRPISLETNVSRYAEGSCLAQFGNTHVLCTASVEDRVPGFLKGSGSGWVTAEYGMLPRATHTRGDREAVRGQQSGRTQEIQRLIGRSLRAVVDLKRLGDWTIRLDCDVLQADGGTRTTAITGAYVALAQAIAKMDSMGATKGSVLIGQVAAVSCGLYRNKAVLDLDYREDSAAEADANFVMTADMGLIEIQATAESVAFPEQSFFMMLALAKKGIEQLCQEQKAVLGDIVPTREEESEEKEGGEGQEEAEKPA